MRFISVAAICLMAWHPALAQTAMELPTLSVEQAAIARENYQQYCALCHGAERQGHVNDHAPSLRSKSLFEGGFHDRLLATSYGRPGTPMSGYSDEIGGPLSGEAIHEMMVWLQDQAGVAPIRFGLEPVHGDVPRGRAIYRAQCAQCHGHSGEGNTGTALGNPAMLSMTSDRFLRHAIVRGREGTEMPAFGATLTDEEIDAVTAFLRSRATGWEVLKPVFRAVPSVERYVLNPTGQDPAFVLKDGLYIGAMELKQALDKRRRLVLLDTRNMSLWQMAHLEGSVPLPYYNRDIDALAADLPRDGTWIVTYCECPRAAAEYVNRQLAERGFRNLAVLWEGVYGWIALGYPVSRGETTPLMPLRQAGSETPAAAGSR